MSTAPRPWPPMSLPAASLLRAYLLDDESSGMLIIAQNGGQDAGGAGRNLERLTLAATALAARTLLAANGYDVAKCLAVVDTWIASYAAEQEPAA